MHVLLLYHLELEAQFYFYFILFIYFWLSWVFVTMPRLSVVMATRGYSLVEVSELLLVEVSELLMVVTFHIEKHGL